MIISIASGKGGVGKSLLSSSLLYLFSKEKKVVGLDCDVDNPCMHLWLGIRRFNKKKLLFINYRAFQKKEANFECPFGAIRNGKIIRYLCHGCGLCEIKGVAKIRRVLTGKIKVFEGDFILITGELSIGQTGSGLIVEKMKEISERYEKDVEIRDSPAGIGCSVVASIKDCDIVVLVCEPTKNSYEALKRTISLCKFFKKKYFLVINKFDLNEKFSKEIENEFEVIGKIRYDERILGALSEMRLPFDSKAWKDILEIKKSLEEKILK